MANILDKFDMISKLDKELKQLIKLFHVFDDGTGFNVLFITSDDRVYGFGANYMGCCGLGHNTNVDSPEIIPELCDKNIKEFFNGYNFVLAITLDYQLYCWGQNNYGQLGIGTVKRSNEYLKPTRNELIGSEQIIDVSCGSSHSLLLTRNGMVFGCGWNKYGQIGCGQQSSNVVSTPIHLSSFTKFQIKSFDCCYNRSYALTNDGLVYSWGYNDRSQLGYEFDLKQCIFIPKLIDINNVLTVCSSRDNTYFLTNGGLIYFCGYFEDQNQNQFHQKTPILMKTKKEAISLHSIPYYQKRISTASVVIEDNICKISGNKITKTEFKTIFDFYSTEFEMTLKTIELNENKSDVSKQNRKDFSNENRFNERFEEISSIGSGGFGSVVKVSDKSNQLIYGIKKIAFNDINENSKKQMLKEVKLLSRCNSSDYSTQYYDSWFESDCLYIQMELCSDNLKNIIKQKVECFKRKPMDSMKLIEFFISCQLFKEVLECVQFLHEMTPKPIIHRDLKPHNILVTEKPNRGRFVKLCDYGLATYDDFEQTQSHTRNVGTTAYMAPEVMRAGDNKLKYSTKSDIYSMGSISFELFAFDINSNDRSITENRELSLKWAKLERLGEKMLNAVYKERPTCTEILSQFNLWGIDIIDRNQRNLEEYSEGLNQLKQFSNRFFIRFFREKMIL